MDQKNNQCESSEDVDHTQQLVTEKYDSSSRISGD